MTRYDSPEHESLRAVIRCMTVNFGPAGTARAREFIACAFRVNEPEQLSAFGAHYCRKHLERALPLAGDLRC